MCAQGKFKSTGHHLTLSISRHCGTCKCSSHVACGNSNSISTPLFPSPFNCTRRYNVHNLLRPTSHSHKQFLDHDRRNRIRKKPQRNPLTHFSEEKKEGEKLMKIYFLLLNFCPCGISTSLKKKPPHAHTLYAHLASVVFFFQVFFKPSAVLKRK